MSKSNRGRISLIIAVWIMGIVLSALYARDWLTDPLRIFYNGGLDPDSLEFIEAYWPDRLVEPSGLIVPAGEELLPTWTKAEFRARLSRFATVIIVLSYLIAVGLWLKFRAHRALNERNP